jgi:hypothetical protein
MNITLKQLREIDNELVIEGNEVHLHEKVEYISWWNITLSENEWEEDKEEFYEWRESYMESCSTNDNAGVIYASNFPELVDTKLEEWEAIDNTPESGVVIDMWNVISSLFPVIVKFPCDVINEDEEYEVEYWCEQTSKEFEDIESGDYTYKVWNSK